MFNLIARSIFTGLVCLVSLTLHAQPELLLFRKDVVRYRFMPGDPIKLKTTSNKNKSGTISGIYRDYMTFTNRDTVYLNTIKFVDVRGLPSKGFHVSSAGFKLMVAGVVLFLADRLNQSNEGGDATAVTAVSVALFGTGLVLKFVNNDKFRPGRRKRIGTRNTIRLR